MLLRSLHEMNAYQAEVFVCPSVCLLALFNSETAGQISMKYGMEIMSLGSTLKTHRFSAVGNTNMVDERISEVESTPAPLTVALCNLCTIYGRMKQNVLFFLYFTFWLYADRSSVLTTKLVHNVILILVYST
jgi:hypothetical protein